MKTYGYILIAFVLWGTISSCSKDEPDSSKSIFGVNSPEKKNAFDEWLLRNYVQTYNIDYKYRMDDIEIDMSYNLVPAELDKSMALSKIVKHAWLGAYDEVAGINFMRTNAPRVLQIIGSAAWNRGSIVLGTAEGGMKVTLYMANWLNPTDINRLNEYYFNTMHHEFAHILHQNKNYPKEFNTISAGHYAPTTWTNRSALSQFAPLGFISSYAGSQPSEDITEVTARYLTYTDAEMAAVMAAAGEEGKAKLNQKIVIMKSYMKDTWNIDMDVLRSTIQRRCEEISSLQLIEPEWEAILKSAGSRASTPTIGSILKMENERALAWEANKEKFVYSPDNRHCQIVLQMNPGNFKTGY